MWARRIDRGRSLGACVAGALALIALAAGAPSALAAEPPANDEAAWLFDPGAVVAIDLGVSQASIDALEADPDEYQPATFSLRAGAESFGPLDVGIRLKGGASFQTFDGKAAFKVKFNEFVKGQKFEGLKKLTLNSMLQDRSMLHETLAYEVFRAAGVAASRTGYAYLRINGADYGLYLNVETLDDVSLPRWFATTQHLFEGSYTTDVRPADAGDFELDEGDDEELADLTALIAATSLEGGDWSDGMAATADLEQMTRMWAVERYVGHWDGYAGRVRPELDNPNNYYLHSDDASLFSMLPWGTDQTWGVPLAFDEPGGLLFDRCLADASCEALYVAALEQVGSVVGGLELDRKAVEIAGLLAPCQALESKQRREYGTDEVEWAVAATRDFVAVRPLELGEWLGAPAGDPPAEDPPGGGSDQQPCPPLPPEQSSPGVAWSAETAPQRRKLHVGPPRVHGTTVVTRLNLPGSGRVEQRVIAPAEGSSWIACRTRRVVDHAGRVTVHCRLAPWARQRLTRGPVQLRVVLAFTPSGGDPNFHTRRLLAPRLPK